MHPRLAKAGVLCLPPVGSRNTKKQIIQRAHLDGYFLDLKNEEHRAIAAVTVAKFIRGIWKFFWPTYYRKRDETSAEWFAAKYLDVKLKAVLRKKHKGAGRRKKKSVPATAGM